VSTGWIIMDGLDMWDAVSLKPFSSAATQETENKYLENGTSTTEYNVFTHSLITGYCTKKYQRLCQPIHS
jgi:hypothetical protein